MRRFHFLLLAIFLVSSQLFSGEYKTGRSIKIQDSIRNDLYTAADVLSISTQIHGDVWAAAGQATIENSTMNNAYIAAGDIIINNSQISNSILAAETIKFQGTVTGSLKAAGGTLFISGTIERDLFVAGGSIYIEKDAVIKGDLIAAGGKIVIYGNVEGNIKGSFESFELYGKAGKNVSINVDNNLYLGNSARIDSNFCYKSSHDHDFDHRQIGGNINFEKTPKRTFEFEFILFFFQLFIAVSALIATIVLIALTRNKLEPFIKNMDKSLAVTLVIGGISIIAVPVLLILSFGLVITFPIAILLFCLSVIFFFTGKLFLSIYIGSKLLYLINKKEANLYLSGLLGVVILFGLFFIPYLGIILYVLTSIWGYGIACKFLQQLFKKAE